MAVKSQGSCTVTGCYNVFFRSRKYKNSFLDLTENLIISAAYCRSEVGKLKPLRHYTIVRVGEVLAQGPHVAQ